MPCTSARGDIHGQMAKTTSLWSNLYTVLNRFSSLCHANTNVIFLGDYCDRGPNTREVLDFLVALPQTHSHYKFRFLCGNHDFAMLKYLDTEGIDHSHTCDGFIPKVKASTFYEGVGASTMHLQGRRWAGSVNGSFPDSIYDAAATFLSYGVKYADRDGLLSCLPFSHYQFLNSLEHVVDISVPNMGRILAVHGGLEGRNGGWESVEEEIASLKRKREDVAWIEPISGRDNVLAIPEELNESWMVSGHHGIWKVDRKRLILDECGGKDDRLLSALILITADDSTTAAIEGVKQDHKELVTEQPSPDPAVRMLKISSSC